MSNIVKHGMDQALQTQLTVKNQKFFITLGFFKLLQQAGQISSFNTFKKTS